MTARRWRCPKCATTYPRHPAHIAMAHKCNPRMRGLVELVADDGGGGEGK